MGDMYVLHCKVIGGSAYEMPCVGYEDLGDVLEDLARLNVETGLPPAPPDCEYWALSNADGTEWAVQGKRPYTYGDGPNAGF